MELKLSWGRCVNQHNAVLIVPLWNWNKWESCWAKWLTRILIVPLWNWNNCWRGRWWALTVLNVPLDRTRVWHIIAQANVATLYHCVQFSQFADNLIIEIVYAPVIKPKLLYALWRYKTSAYKLFHHAFRYPLCIFDVTLSTRKLLDEVWVD